MHKQINIKKLIFLVNCRLNYLNKKKRNSKFLLKFKLCNKDFQPLLNYILYKYKNSSQKIFFYNTIIDKLLSKFWKLYWYNLYIYLMLNFVFPKKANFFCNKYKETILKYFLYKEIIFFKNPINLKQLVSMNISLKRKLDLYNFFFDNYYNFFTFPLKFLKKNLLNINFFLNNNKNDYKKKLYKSNLELKKKKYLIFFNFLYSMFIFQKNKELFEMEFLFFKQLQLKYNYKFLTTKRISEINLLNNDSSLFISSLLKRYISILLIPFYFKKLSKKMQNIILDKDNFDNLTLKNKDFKTTFQKNKKILTFDIKKKLILKSLIYLAKFNIKNKDKTLFLFFKKSFSNIFITLTDLNLKVIVCKTSTISGILGNKRRKIAPQAIEYIISSLKNFFVKNIYICLNLRSNIRKYLYTLIRELNINNINIKGLFRFCLRAHNGVRGRTSLKKI